MFGFDVGLCWIGVVIGSLFGMYVWVIVVVDVYGNGLDWVVVECLFKEWCLDGLVVGDLLILDG